MSPRFLVALSILAASLVPLSARADEASPPSPAALSCTTGPHSGTYDGEAETATELVCEDLRHAGARGPHQVTVSKLGAATFLSVTDSTGDSRRLQLSGLEEVPVAAPRLAAAITHKTTTKDTQEVDNIVGEEQRELKRQKGELLGGAGIAGVHVVGTGAMPAVNLRAAYETVDFAIVGDLRYGLETDTKDKSALSIGLGGRHYFGRGDLAPFAGGGMSFTDQTFHGTWNQQDGEWRGTNNGVGVYAEAGVEALRTHRSRLTMDVRAEVPFYAVTLEKTTTLGPQSQRLTHTMYSVPVSFAVAYSYRGI